MALSLNGLKHIAAQPVGWASKAAGAVGSVGGLVPNSTASRLSSIGSAVTNPNVVYSGPLNPFDSNFRASGGANWTTTAPAAAKPKGPAGGPPVVQGMETNVPGSGLYGGNGGAADPNTDPTAVARLRKQIGGLMDLFKMAYEDVVSKVDTMASQKKADINTQYDQQGNALATNYGNTSQSIDNILFGQGAGNSSYDATQQGQALDAYHQAVDTMNTNKNNDLGAVGQYAATTKAQLGASVPSYDPNNYNTVSDLQTINDAVNSAVKQLQVSGAGLGTNNQNIAALNAIAPPQEQGSNKLKAQLDKLSAVNAPPDAKRAIAETIVSNSGNDPAWLSYFDKLIQQTGSAATPTAVQPPA